LKEAEAQLNERADAARAQGEREAAEADMQAAKGGRSPSAWPPRAEERRRAGVGPVQDTFFVIGEWVPAGRPVVSLLPPAM